MDLFYVLLILLIVTRGCAEVAVRIGQPALLGELVGGILIGATAGLFGDFAAAFADLDSDRTFQAVLDLAVFFLMLLAGIEMRPKDLAKASGKAIPIAIAGMLIPLALGFVLGLWWLPESNWKMPQSLFIGVALAITAVPVAVKVLMDLGQLESRVGQTVVAAAVIDDVLSLVLLAVLTAVLSAGEVPGPGSLITLSAGIAIFFAVAFAAGRYLLPRLSALAQKLELEHADFTVLIVFGLALSVLAELLEMHFLIGAFTAGVLFTRNAVGSDTFHRMEKRTEMFTLGFFAPVFFASIGLHLNLAAVVEAPVFLLTLIVFATIGKLFGAGIVALLTGFSRRDSIAIGAAMNARGAVEIIIADIALRAGLFDHPDPPPPAIDYLFSAIVIMAIVTTISSPLALRPLLTKRSSDS
ncbi:MAG: cation:proton antiporter [Gammaproteobacteria bacterium]|jgi:Kef-type K+ transport system membrane component KefB